MSFLNQELERRGAWGLFDVETLVELSQEIDASVL